MARLANSWSSGTCSGAGALLSFLSPTETLCLFGTCSNGLNTRFRVGERRVLCGDSCTLVLSIFGMQNENQLRLWFFFVWFFFHWGITTQAGSARSPPSGRSAPALAQRTGGNLLLCVSPCRRAKWGSRSPPTTPRAYLCSVEGPSVPAGSQFLGVAPAPV